MRFPRAMRFCVASSRSEPNWENAARDWYWASSSRMRPETCRRALDCAFPPTRETESPAFTAGRTPALNRSVSR